MSAGRLLRSARATVRVELVEGWALCLRNVHGSTGSPRTGRGCLDSRFRGNDGMLRTWFDRLTMHGRTRSRHLCHSGPPLLLLRVGAVREPPPGLTRHARLDRASRGWGRWSGRHRGWIPAFAGMTVEVWGQRALRNVAPRLLASARPEHVEGRTANCGRDRDC